MPRTCSAIVFVVLAIAAALVVAAPAKAADPRFEAWLETLWPDAQKLGVSRKTFDAATRGLEPDRSLPDLELPGRRTEARQPEFVSTPADYVRETTIARLAERARALKREHRATLARIEREFGVPPNIILAIWGRETAFGGHRLPHAAIRVLATQAYLGRRKHQFREEFLHALKMLQDGHATLAEMRSSWAGAMGLTQLLPTEFYKYATDFDGDGRIDIFRSVPDALAAAARQLVGKGWQPNKHWAYEVRAPRGIDCTIAEPSYTLPLAKWLEHGFVPAYGRKVPAGELGDAASLLMPEGIYGPAFLTPKNYFVIKDYNFSDLYVLFVGHLADRIDDPRGFQTRWSKDQQLRTAQVEAMQRRLSALGIYKDKIDGKAGMLTRSALGAYQKQNGLKLDCWPSAAVLDHMQRTR